MSTPAARTPPAGPQTRVWRLAVLLFLLAFAVVAFLRRPRPGRTTLTYRIGQVDPRFGLSREAFGEAIEQAVAIWAVPVSRPLFRLDPEGAIEINLVYDQRQANLEQVRRLNEGLGASLRTFQEMKGNYEAIKAAYETKREALHEDFNAYNQKVASANAEIEALDRRGDASPAEARRLTRAGEELKASLAGLQSRQRDLEVDRAVVENARTEGNQAADAARARNAASQAANRGLTEAFDEGEYVRRFGRQSITIYAFPSGQVLVRVLAHELGHALGLEHGQDPASVMYPQLRSEAWELSPEDLRAIRARCGLD